ncbi:hypothetical protein IEQ34_007021 [Dendrobium chrysotoxum]|uniref:Uncharacterized protein n=1 Tax=Dendrobium chrysotoxum TaxID=161865 RepID=A0AAV7GQV5_DENCH|nr:hypothetical protein IEQ34_007021 [Dendrobium chrysotoxum]
MMGEAQSRIPVIRSEEVDRHLQMFLRLKPPRFEGTVKPRAAEDYLRRLKKIFDGQMHTAKDCWRLKLGRIGC